MAASASDPRARGGLQPGVFGPVEAFGKPRSGGPDWGRLALLSFALVVAFAVVTVGTYAGLIFLELRGIGEVDLTPGGPTFVPYTEGETALEVPEVEDEADRTTILLVGSDSREGLSREELDRIGTDDAGTDLTDTIILLQIDPATDAAAMLSFPRDLLVERCDGSTGKINEAFYIGEQQAEGQGPRCLINTLTALTRIQIDHYVRVNFAGFVHAVDALGGVEFYVDEPIEDQWSGIEIEEPGCVTFDGVKALQFVRARRVDNDFGRIARQQRFAREMLDEATSLGTLANPARVASLISSVSDVLETDTGFGASEIIDLLNGIQGISNGAVDARTVPSVVGSYGRASVVRAIEHEAEELYTAFRSGELLPEGVGTAGEPQELGPESTIPIRVENGSSTDGLAEESAAVLEALGFTVSDTGTADNYGFQASLILHPPDREDHAEILSEALGGVSINSGNADVDELTLILGGAFDPEEHAPEGYGEAPSEGPLADGSEDPDLTASADPSASESEEEFVGAELSEVQC